MNRATQIGLALVIAGMLVAVLQWCVGVSVAQATHGEGDGNPGLVRSDREPPPDLAAGGRQLLYELPGTAIRFHLATILDQLPKDCAPVIRVLPGGSLQIPVAPPIAMRPGAMTWPDVGVLLPQARVCDLSASERSSLLAIWSRLAGSTGLTPDRVRTPGCRFQEGELDLLLRWLR